MDQEPDTARAASLRLTLAAEADPIFFKWQAGEATKEEWLAKRGEVKARFAQTA